MKRKALALALLTTVVCSRSVLAADASTTPDPVISSGGTIHFTGEITNGACAVSISNSGQTVPLGQVTAKTFSASGSTSPSKDFEIVLSNCDTSVYKTASAAFSGTPDATNPALLKIIADGTNSAATGVGIQIMDSHGTVLAVDGTHFSTAQQLMKGTSKLAFTARYVATNATPTAGAANADATFVMQYQ